jgi:hypothetical protein
MQKSGGKDAWAAFALHAGFGFQLSSAASATPYPRLRWRSVSKISALS